MALILDSGALIALDKNDRAMWVRLKSSLAGGEPPLTHGGVLGQVWRDGARQARLAQVVSGIYIQPLDGQLGRDAGELLATAHLTDVIDAALVMLSRDGDDILTSDPDDLTTLIACAGHHVEVIAV